ncbi:hypothetical protein CHUAL_009450 [Chamberlinius hualienensis]
MAAVTNSDVTQGEASSPTIAKPLYYQQLKRALRLDIFLNQAEKIFATNLTDDEATAKKEGSLQFQNEENSLNDTKLIKGIMTTKQERRSDLARLYNFSRVKKGRKWLKNLLLSDSSEDETEDTEQVTDSDLKVMLKLHLLKTQYQREFHANKELKQYQYYSVGLLSNHDRFPEHQKSIIGNKKKTKEKKLERKMKAKLKKIKKKEKRYLENQDLIKKEPAHSESVKSEENCFADGPPPKSSRRKAPMSEAALTAKRRRLWVALSKKEIPKAQKQKVSVHKEVLTNCKKMALACQREVRKSALQFQKSLKEGPSRARRLTREMILYWKRYEKVEKELRKRAEKEAQEQLKIDVELREAKRQQRKLNFLITQTELYAHFMSRKLGGAGQDPNSVQEKILNQLNEAPAPHHRGFIDDDYDSEEVKSSALRNAKEAFDTHQSKLRVFGHDSLLKKKSVGEDFKITSPSISTEQDRPQPNIFKGILKSYQLKGMNWLANLYDQGINGILADEMGLGKTVESIAFLAHIAESQNTWGPFLVIAPASTLHNWQQEFSRFVPKFKVLPYWGNTIDRKVLRKFWTQRDLHTEDASFHVLITSYQLVVQDVKYFQRIKWQYMVLDEAQAIKSSSSVRWKSLLGFNCRNRLLLTGTPIQNSMAELWALLHFIMPTLFDSHEEFNEWFSKDIENHAENKSTMDEKHLSRLHMILKPFMLRRVKKDVENELSDKIEILMYCHLTTRQKMLYEGLKQKISIEDLLHSASGSSTASQAQSATSSLMNLVMQFRKVCNHSELFERREVKSPFILKPETQTLSKLVYRDGILINSLPSRDHILFGSFNIYHPYNIHNSIFKEGTGYTGFAFTRFCALSPNELFKIMLQGLLHRWVLICDMWEKVERLYHAYVWQGKSNRSMETLFVVDPFSAKSWLSFKNSSTLQELIFTSYNSDVYTHNDHVIHSMPETTQHRKIREKRLISRHQPIKPLADAVTSQISTQAGASRPSKPVQITKTPQSPSFHSEDQQLPEFPHRELPSHKLECQRTSMPLFLNAVCPRVSCLQPEFHCSDRSYAYWKTSCLTGLGKDGMDVWLHGREELAETFSTRKALFQSCVTGGVTENEPRLGWSNVIIPDKETLVTDSGKLHVLDALLARLKDQGHRVLIYSQMTRMIDLLEEYMWHRKHTYMRLDGSSKISDRRDMVADFQSRSDIFVFLLSTRAGGLGINLTAADTVVFYDSDWNPTVDQQAMDRAHRLGQTKQVTVYRLICKGTIEERILQRAREKSEIQRMVISGGNFKPDTLKPTEVVSLLLDDDELERKFRQRQAERKLQDDQTKDRVEKRRKREKPNGDNSKRGRTKKPRLEENVTIPANQDTESVVSVDSVPPSPSPSEKSFSSAPIPQDETSNEDSLVVDDGLPIITPSPISTSTPTTNLTVSKKGSKAGNGAGKSPGSTPTGRGRGRPKGTCGSKRTSGRGGRGSGTAAAEMAGAQAGATAAYAAYGYSVAGVGSSNVSGTPIGRGHVMVRGGGIRMRGPMTITPPRFPYKFPNSNEATGSVNTPTSSLGPVHPSPHPPSTT